MCLMLRPLFTPLTFHREDSEEFAKAFSVATGDFNGLFGPETIDFDTSSRILRSLRYLRG